jgi:hypothetical protein
MENTQILKVLEDKQIAVESTFVPWSRSRNYDESKPISGRSLNWKVRLVYKGKTIIETDYSAGIAHCPSYKASVAFRMSTDMKNRIHDEIEKGFAQRGPEGQQGWSDKKRPIVPETCDVVHSLLMDADAIDHGGFEEWASNFGYDTDSRKAEATYRACLEIGLKLRNGLGDELVSELREVFQDY